MSAILLGIIFSNSGNFGATVAMFAFRATGFQYVVIFMVIHAFLMNTVEIIIASIIMLILEIVMVTYEKIL